MDGYSYVLELVDQMSGPAKSVRQQIDALTSGMADQKKEADELRSVYDELRKSGDLTAKQEQEITNALAKHDKQMDQSASQVRKLVAEEHEASKSTNDVSSSLAGAGEAMAAFAAAAVIAAAALAAVVFGGAKIALDASHFKSNSIDALRSVSDTQEQAEATFEAIRKAGDSVGIADEKAQKMGLALLDAGVKQNDLGDAIKAIATLQKARGDDAAKRIQDLIEKSAAADKFAFNAKSLKGTGISEADVVSQLAKDLKKSNAEVKAQLEKGKIDATAGVKAIQEVIGHQLGTATGFETAADGVHKIYEMFTRLFEDVNVGPLLDAMQEVASWLDKGTVAGDALHWLFTTVFNELFALAKDLLPYMKTGFLELVIVTLQIYIAMKPLIKQFEDLADKMGIAGDDADTLGVIIVGAFDVLGFLAQVVITSLQGTIWVISGAIDIVNQWASAISEGVDLVVGLFESLSQTLDDLFSPEKGSATAVSLIEGFLSGIAGGGPLVDDAMNKLGQGALDSVKDVLGIHSPSTKMAALADHTVDGFVNQVDTRGPDAANALSNVVMPPKAADAGGAPAASGAAISVTIAPGAVVVQAGAGANTQEIMAAVEAAMANMAEMIAMQLGGAVGDA